MVYNERMNDTNVAPFKPVNKCLQPILDMQLIFFILEDKLINLHILKKITVIVYNSIAVFYRLELLTKTKYPVAKMLWRYFYMLDANGITFLTQVALT